MTPEQVRQRIREIEAIARDDESAHSEEDQLHRAVLEHIAINARSIREARALASAALATQAVRFQRWCA